MKPTRMWFALARLYGSSSIPVLGLYEWKHEKVVIGGFTRYESRLHLIGGHRVAK